MIIRKIVLNDSSSINHELPRIIGAIQQDGFCLIKGWENSLTCFYIIAKHLGDFQAHIRSDQLGFTNTNPVSDEWLEYKEEYQAITATDFGPHTDGTFLQGLAYIDNNLHKIGPPKMIALQCQKAANDGKGGNLLLDGKAIYHDLLCQNKSLFKALNKKIVAFSRDNLFAEKCSIFSQIKGNKRLMIRFSSDKKMFVDEKYLGLVQHFQDSYILNKKYQIDIDLLEGEILIIDNFRMLHARKSFDSEKITNALSERKLHRIWIFNDMGEEKMRTLNGEASNIRAFTPFDHYQKIPKNNISSIKCGIKKTNAVTNDDEFQSKEFI